MFSSVSWLHYWSFVAIIICAYYLIVYVIYYSTNIKNISSFPFGWLDKLKSKPQTGNARSKSGNSYSNSSHLNSEISLNDGIVDEDMLPIIDSVKYQIKVILQNAANENQTKEEVLYSVKLLLKNFLSLNNRFFQKTINQFILFESLNLHSIKVTEDDLKRLWVQ